MTDEQALEAVRRIIEKPETCIAGMTADGRMWFHLRDVRTVALAYVAQETRVSKLEAALTPFSNIMTREECEQLGGPRAFTVPDDLIIAARAALAEGRGK